LKRKGANKNIITITGKLKSFTEKLELWTRKVRNSYLHCFPGCETFPNKFKMLSEVQKTVQHNFVSTFQNSIIICTNGSSRYDKTYLPLTEEENLINLKNIMEMKSKRREWLQISYDKLRVFLPNLKSRFDIYTKTYIHKTYTV